MDLFCQQGTTQSTYAAEAKALLSVEMRNKDRDLGKIEVESDNFGIVEVVNNKNDYSNLATDML